jgi:hypothetical protein
VYLLNRLPTKTISAACPHVALFGSTPSYEHLHVFGCTCYPNIAATTPHKLAPRSTLCVFLGYFTDQKCYRRVYLSTNHLIVSCHVIFDEDNFLLAASPNLTDLNFLCESGSPVFTIGIPVSLAGSSTVPACQPALMVPPGFELQAAPIPVPLPVPRVPPGFPPCTWPTLPIAYAHHPRQRTTPSPATLPRRPTTVISVTPPVNPHSRVTRDKDGFRLPRGRLTLIATASSTSPSAILTSVRAALADLNWRADMEEEYRALMSNGTWEFVSQPRGSNVITGKWVFLHKYLSDGMFDRYKAHWVLQGFTQLPGVDYDETFSPIMKPTTIHTVLSIGTSCKWSIQRLDVKNTFLHGTLSETTFCSQTSSFTDLAQPNLICHLHKSLYGLKQAPRV